MPPIVASNGFAACGSYSFSRLNSSLAAVISQVCLQLQVHCHHNHVVATVDIRSRVCSALCTVDAVLESLWCENIVDLVVCDAIGRASHCYSGDLVRKDNIHQGHLVPVCDFQKSFSSFVDFSCSKTSRCSRPLSIDIRSNLSIPISLYNEVVPGNFFDGDLELS